MTFAEAWEMTPRDDARRSNHEPVRWGWKALLVPLPALSGPAWAYALTYPVHRREARLDNTFAFEKSGAAELASAPVQHRPGLDYEAEIALLLHRNEPERFGFLFANDLTDRAIQVRSFDRRNPAPGFSAAKSFPGALRVGPLLAIGDGEIWPQLKVHLEVNGVLRQHVEASECLLTPREFHQQIFRKAHAGDWALALTGTTGGTIFKSPTFAQQLKLLLRSGFSTKRAREAWLEQFQFLGVDDRLEMKSELLGRSYATIVA